MDQTGAVRSLIALSLVLVAACAPGGASPSQEGLAPAQPAPSRTIAMAIRYEPTDLALKMSAQGGGDFLKRPFNASLALIDGAGNPVPYLAESLPQLNTERWRVFPDGRMETTHRLRSGLTWHDGNPLTAEDFVFAWRLYATPGLGVFSSKPQDLMDQVLAPDPLTLVIQWNALYPDASALTESRDGSLEPLPRHILEGPAAEVMRDPTLKDALFSLPFWTQEYIGAGAYQLERWEPGSFLRGVAFAGHALGRPRTERIELRVFADENTVLTNLLAESIDVATRFTLRFEHALVLKREWAASGRQGFLLSSTSGLHPIVFQFRPEFLKHPVLLDLRVRRALVHAIDRQALVDGLFEGEGRAPDTFIAPEEPYFSEVDRAITKYTYDPRRTEQLMAEAGFLKDRDGLFARPTGERFQPEYQTLAGTVFERGQAIVTETWRRAGIDAKTSILPAAQVRDHQVRHTFPGISTLGSAAPDVFLGHESGTAATRWVGQNRGGWVNAEYDQQWQIYSTTLDRSQRHLPIVQMMKIASDELPGFPLYYNVQPAFAHLPSVQGPNVGVSGTTGFWNLKDWTIGE